MVIRFNVKPTFFIVNVRFFTIFKTVLSVVPTPYFKNPFLLRCLLDVFFFSKVTFS